MTAFEYAAHLARQQAKACGVAGELGVTREAELHDDILEYCRAKSWPVIHSRMDMASTIAVGAPDFVVALPGGRTLWVECKSGNNKLTAEQRAFRAWLEHNGHVYLECRNFLSFVTTAETMIQ